MKTFAAVFVAFVLMVLQTALLPHFGLTLVRPDLGLCVVMFLAVHRTPVAGAVAAAMVGYLTDVFCAAPRGEWVFLHVAVFLVGKMVASALDLSGLVGQLLFAITASVSLYSARFLLHFVVREGTALHTLDGVVLLEWTLQNALAAPFVFALLLAIDKRLGPDRNDLGALHRRF